MSHNVSALPEWSRPWAKKRLAEHLMADRPEMSADDWAGLTDWLDDKFVIAWYSVDECRESTTLLLGYGLPTLIFSTTAWLMELISRSS